MRVLIASALIVSLFAPPAIAQEATQKTKTTPQHRTYVESIDMSSSEATLRGFLDAYAASDFFKAYYLLSPEAKSGFLNKIYEFNEAHLFPGMSAGYGAYGLAPEGEPLADDVAKDIYLDSAVVFDNTMLKARNEGLLPFDVPANANISRLFEREDQARYNVGVVANSGFAIISTIRLSNGEWRIEKIVLPSSDPDARPWGFK